MVPDLQEERRVGDLEEIDYVNNPEDPDAGDNVARNRKGLPAAAPVFWLKDSAVCDPVSVGVLARQTAGQR